MNCEPNSPFESIEGAQDYLALLAQTVVEVKRDTEADIRDKTTSGAQRQVEALRLVSYNLEKLEYHIRISRRLLNDLRTLRRLLHKERQPLAA